MTNNEESVKKGLFPLGEKNEAYQKYFIGQSYLENLVADPALNVGVSNVSFEPGCRNNWHKHNNGFQILIATAGEGWYQEENKPAQKLHPGDVVVVMMVSSIGTVLLKIVGLRTLQLQRERQNG